MASHSHSLSGDQQNWSFAKPAPRYQHTRAFSIDDDRLPAWRDSLLSRSHKPPQKTDPNQTFELFPTFPTEVRLNIWRFTCFPRLVEIKVVKTVHVPEENCSFKAFHNTTQLPATFSVCKESRAVVLAHYKRCFGSIMRADLAPSTIYFNPSVDTLFFRSNGSTMTNQHALKDFIEHAYNSKCGHERLDMDLVQRIAISHRARTRSVDLAELAPHLSFLPALREFTIVAERYEGPYRSQVVLKEPAPDDPEIRILRRWMDIHFPHNLMKWNFRPWGVDRKRDMVLRVMEADYENMYPPPPLARRPMTVVKGKVEKLGKEKEKEKVVDVGVAAVDDWSRDLMRSLDLLAVQ
ncbi:hypothetical protein EG329_005041 [Mollisiaceae sp. DMI_Dod_QoI]|nr:hypothetical protein EG329_005041 [Helotiales sp. DMI_Dod_QoI]